jgi:hypothetical protein
LENKLDIEFKDSNEELKINLIVYSFIIPKSFFKSDMKKKKRKKIIDRYLLAKEIPKLEILPPTWKNKIKGEVLMKEKELTYLQMLLVQFAWLLQYLAQLLADEISKLLKDWSAILRDIMLLIIFIQNNITILRKENIMHRAGRRKAKKLVKTVSEEELIIDDNMLGKLKKLRK